MKAMKTVFRTALLPSLLAFFAALSMAFTLALPPEIKIDDAKYNFGFIHQGDVVSHEFLITNTGDEPLLISDAQVQCTCTTVDFPKQPLMKGQSAKIKVTFDSKSAMDRQERTVILSSNAKNSPATLTFKAIVLKKK